MLRRPVCFNGHNSGHSKFYSQSGDLVYEGYMKNGDMTGEQMSDDFNFKKFGKQITEDFHNY